MNLRESRLLESSIMYRDKKGGNGKLVAGLRREPLWKSVGRKGGERR